MSATSFSLTTFLKGLFSRESAPGPVDEARSASPPARQVPPADTSARSPGTSFYCCYGVRQKTHAYEADAAADGASTPDALSRPGLDEVIQVHGGFLQPEAGETDDDGRSVLWPTRAVRAVPAALAATTPTMAMVRSDDTMEAPAAPDAAGDRKSVASDPTSAEAPSANTQSAPVSGRRAEFSAQTLSTAQRLADQVQEILNGTQSDAIKREQLGKLLAGASQDPQLVECLILDVLKSPKLKDAQKVYFVAYVARHYIDDGRTEPRRPLSRDAVLAVTQSLRDHRAQWKDKTCYGQAFSHLYEGARYILEESDLVLEKSALQEQDFVASLRNQSGDFRRWAIAKLDERLKAPLR